MPRAKDSTAGASTAQSQQDAVSDGIDHFELPRSLIMKLARASQVPENTKFSKEVILSILKASTVFINYLAATAHEVASQKQHKSISATDVLKALELVEFGDIAKNIQGELQVYRELQKTDKRKSAKSKAKDTPETASAATKAKGKTKAGAPTDAQEQGVIPPILIPRPSTTSAATLSGDPSSEVEPDHGPLEDVDQDQEMLDQGDNEEEGDEDVDEDLDEGVEETEEPEDLMVLEDEEIRKDAKGLEAKGPETGDAIED